ncbi:UDP-N-acetylmuramoyl-L-alanyl-D-glutamate--2,6-diaminopimelate ligase [uncultured archaeon]|nr:UDP-N-acetylmuramoyl-L-alanyl-D-glutamate--2,6-diaminopimelate ligase [uncultured archaeon]
MEAMDYRQSKEWLESLGTKMEGFDLETAKKLCKLSNLDLSRLKAIHVAGSNGKGSTCAFAERILREQGYKTGLYTSPHLVEPAERIQINGKKIPEKKFAILASRFRQIAEENNIPATYFEANTAMAFKYFLDEGIDIAVVEVGLGGRLDATNIIGPLVSVITSISLEHTQFLGDTIEKIAWEKAGIIKENSIVVAGEGNAGIKVLEEVARQRNSRIIYARYKTTSCTKNGNKFDLASPFEMKGLKMKMLGPHQVENASLAAAAVLALAEKGVEISEKAIRSGLAKAFWPGRLEIVRKKPIVLLDGAHNPDGWNRLGEALGIFRRKKLIVVFAAMKDKDISKAKRLLAAADGLILTKPEMERAEEPERIKEIIGFGKAVVPAEKAIAEAVSKAGKKDLVLITGSLYLAGTAYRRFKIKI